MKMILSVALSLLLADFSMAQTHDEVWAIAQLWLWLSGEMLWKLFLL